jgi:predicted dehydrogenase
MKKTIKWGMIGCGDVTEVKSGPAFSKVSNSKLVAVMSRNPQRAADYASRHQVSKWYDDAQALIDDPEVNAIYIATPPLSHEELTLAALKAGKPVYVEKPMAVDATAGRNMEQAASERDVKLTVAHYRRQQPIFKRIKSLIDENAIGDIKYVNLQFLSPALTAEELLDPKIKWRVEPEISGGGLFHDLAPHQLDLMLYFFGPVEKAIGLSTNHAGLYPAEDFVSGLIKFRNKIMFNGMWCFSAPNDQHKDRCEIVGTDGSISFSVFGKPVIELIQGEKTENISFEPLQHVQQPMIEATVQYFLGAGPNPCTAEDGVQVMSIIDSFSNGQTAASNF